MQETQRYGSREFALPPESGAARLLGGAVVMELEFTLGREADRAATDRLLAAVRLVTASHGVASRTGSLLEWSSGGKSKSLSVNVAPGAGRTMVMILVDRSTSATTLAILSLVGAGVMVGVTGTFLDPTAPGTVAAMAGIAAAWTLAARMIWARSSRRLRAMLARLNAAIAEAVETGPVPPS